MQSQIAKYFKLEKVISTKNITNFEEEKELSQQEEQEQQNQKIQNKNKYKFIDSWIDKYPWLSYEIKEQDASKKMYCKECLAFREEQMKLFSTNKIGSFEIISNVFTLGCERFKNKALQEHIEITSHKKAIQFQLQKKKRLNKNIFENKIRDSFDQDTIKPLFVAQFLICQQKMAFDTFPHILTAFKYLNENLTNSYHNDIAGKEIMECIYLNVKNKLKKQLNNSKLPISLSFDTKKNRSNELLLAVAIRYIDTQYEVRENFLYIGELTKKNNEVIFQEVFKILTDFELKDQLQFISTDGEISLSSQKNGVVGKIMQHIPWLLYVHYRAHCTNLGLNDCYKQYDIMQKANKNIFKICSFFNFKKSNNLIYLNNRQKKLNQVYKSRRINTSKINLKRKAQRHLWISVGFHTCQVYKEFLNNMNRL